MDSTFAELKRGLELAEQQSQEVEAKLRGEVVSLLLQLNQEKKNNQRLEEELDAMKKAKTQKMELENAQIAKIKQEIDTQHSPDMNTCNRFHDRNKIIEDNSKRHEPLTENASRDYASMRFDFTQRFKL